MAPELCLADTAFFGRCSRVSAKDKNFATTHQYPPRYDSKSLRAGLDVDASTKVPLASGVTSVDLGRLLDATAGVRPATQECFPCLNFALRFFLLLFWVCKRGPTPALEDRCQRAASRPTSPARDWSSSEYGEERIGTTSPLSSRMRPWSMTPETLAIVAASKIRSPTANADGLPHVWV